MSPTFADATAVLARHGIDPAADAAALLAALADRGWAARVEEIEGGARGRPPRVRALALRPYPPGHVGLGWSGHEHLQASGWSKEEALVRLLAAAIGRGG